MSPRPSPSPAQPALLTRWKSCPEVLRAPPSSSLLPSSPLPPPPACAPPPPSFNRCCGTLPSPSHSLSLRPCPRPRPFSFCHTPARCRRTEQLEACRRRGRSWENLRVQLTYFCFLTPSRPCPVPTSCSSSHCDADGTGEEAVLRRSGTWGEAWAPRALRGLPPPLPLLRLLRLLRLSLVLT